MEKLFVNDPFVRVYEAFKKLYPDNDCFCFWTDDLEDAHGVTLFSDNPRMSPEIFISADADHGEVWENAFEAIHQEYCRATGKGEMTE